VNGEPTPVEALMSKELEAETALKNLEVHSIQRQKSIEDLRKINNKKDQTIASLSQLNDELISEIKRIKGSLYQNSKTDGPSENSGSQLGSLKSEVKKLKNNLALKSEELKSLRYRNDSLEDRISDLELSPTSKKSELLPTFSSISYSSTNINPINQKRSGQCKLQFEAVVTALNGKSKEAFYTEFFILPISLENIMRKGGIALANYSGIDTYAELWARSRKNAFLYPDVHKNIRSLLLNFEDRGEGKRVRTDVDGSALVDDLQAGKYFVIGTASLGKVGVTWSVPVSLNTGNNKISLTLANCSWSL
jgi:regulator of replication initiation timing